MASSDLNPIQHASDWHYLTVSGVKSPGVISSGGVRGFERATEWDKKKGKGTQGATLSLVQYPPAEGSFEFLLWLPEHFTQWAQFRPLLKYNAKKKSGDAFEIYYPSLADLDINSVVTTKISPTLHKGSGLYAITVELIEYFKPPPVSIVVTPARANSAPPNNTGFVPGDDPITAAKQVQIAGLLDEAADPVGPPRRRLVG